MPVSETLTRGRTISFRKETQGTRLQTTSTVSTRSCEMHKLSYDCVSLRKPTAYLNASVRGMVKRWPARTCEVKVTLVVLREVWKASDGTCGRIGFTSTR